MKSMIKKSLKQEKRKRKGIFSEIRRKSELCYATSNKAMYGFDTSHSGSLHPHIKNSEL